MTRAQTANIGINPLGFKYIISLLFEKISFLFFIYLIYNNKIIGIVTSIIAAIIHGLLGNIGDSHNNSFVVNS